jgi:hypothetical protein
MGKEYIKVGDNFYEDNKPNTMKKDIIDGIQSILLLIVFGGLFLWFITP